MQVSNSTQTIELMSIERGCCTLHKRPAGASAADFRFLPEASSKILKTYQKLAFFSLSKRRPPASPEVAKKDCAK